MQNINLRRHCYAVGFALAGIYDYLSQNGTLEEGSPEREKWEALGIIHDADYEITKNDWTKHTIILLEWLTDLGISSENPIYKAVQSHNNKFTKLREPQTQLEWALECCDELTGFIVACALVKPEKDLEAVDVDFVKKKWKEKSFAKAVDRSQIGQCESKLDIPLDTFIAIVLKAMKEHHTELGI